MANEQQAASPSMKILNQYIRDLSFENIAAQQHMGATAQPQINVSVSLDARKGEKSDNYEVMLKLKVDSTIEDKKVFLIELDYAGLFDIQNVPEEHMHPYLMVECPRMLFPFVRQIVRDVAIGGGYPALNIDPIDFVQLYRSELERRTAAQAAEATKN